MSSKVDKNKTPKSEKIEKPSDEKPNGQVIDFKQKKAAKSLHDTIKWAATIIDW